MERLRPRDGERAWVRECGLERERLETKKTERTRELKLQFLGWGGVSFKLESNGLFFFFFLIFKKRTLI